MFIDKLHLLVQGGTGGNGCESYFHRTDRKVVPNGGDGGKGGNIIFRASSNAPGLDRLKLKQHLIAVSGGHGGSVRKRGKNGEDLIIFVPTGTKLYYHENHLMIRDLSNENDEVIVANGGDGGSGNDGGKESFLGKNGETLDIEIELLMPADVFLIGLPNSGKTTLLKNMTGIKVEDKDYPFSTHAPIVGVFEYDYKQMMLCELPSIYKGSLEGKGLGIDFLKHLERARHIVFVLDISNEFSNSLKEGLEVLRNAIKLAAPLASDIAVSVLINKIDQGNFDEEYEKTLKKIKIPYFLISAKTGVGIEQFKEFLKKSIKKDENV